LVLENEVGMKITAQEEYGLRCLLQLAVSAEPSLSISDIASKEGLSQPYVAKLLAVLRQAGFIDSVRGRAGGYKLARRAGEIHLGELLEALGEPLFEEPAYCDRHAGTETNGSCVHLGQCSLRALWQTLETWVRTTLDRITLADLVQSETHITELLHQRLAEAVQELPESARITLGRVAKEN
jgi:Rrf2 family protein